jgi:hypothetical protein
MISDHQNLKSGMKIIVKKIINLLPVSSVLHQNIARDIM